MRLQNYTLLYLSIALLVILGIWASIFYINMLDEVYDSIDDGLDNYKMLIIEKSHEDSTVFHKDQFAESNYSVRPISESEALRIHDTYVDTLMYMPFEEDYEPVRLLTTAFVTPGGQHYELKVISSMVEEDDLIEDLLFALMWLYIIILVTMVFVNMVLIRRIWSPFYRIIGQLKDFRLGSRHIFQAPKTRVKEFTDLNQTIELLLQSNLETYNSQKQFIENASHELQTPLAISINKLELLAENTQLPEKEMEIIGSVLENLERLTRLNKSLLLLSKIENKQFESSDPVNLNEIVLKNIADFEDFARHKKILLSFDDIDTIRPRIPKDLAEILVSNLIKNAIVHNTEGGSVSILLKGNSLIVANSGKSEALDPERIFHRFYKESSSKATTGLGLAIIKAIADSWHFRISYSFDGQHIMRIDF